MSQYIITTMFDVSVLLLLFVWCPCMAVNVSVQYNGGLLPDILLLTQAAIFVWFNDTIIVYCYYTLLTMYYNSVFCFVMFSGSAWRLI